MAYPFVSNISCLITCEGMLINGIMLACVCVPFLKEVAEAGAPVWEGGGEGHHPSGDGSTPSLEPMDTGSIALCATPVGTCIQLLETGIAC